MQYHSRETSQNLGSKKNSQITILRLVTLIFTFCSIKHLAVPKQVVAAVSKMYRNENQPEVSENELENKLEVTENQPKVTGNVTENIL